MPKFKCLCGDTINLSSVPNQQAFNLIWEPLIEPLIDDIVAAHQQCPVEEEFHRQAYSKFYNRHSGPEFLQVYECHNCGRLAVFAHASDTVPTCWFQREKVNGDRLASLRSLVQQMD